MGYVEFELSDGSKVLMETDDVESGIVKTGIGDVAKRAGVTFDQAVESAHKAARVVLDKIRSMADSPDEIEITFGLKASGELGNIIVAKAGIEASYSVRVKWKKAETK
jgi:hypothetical protein